MIEKYSDDLKKIEKIGDYIAVIVDLYNSISDDSKEELAAEVAGDIENTVLWSCLVIYKLKNI